MTRNQNMYMLAVSHNKYAAHPNNVWSALSEFYLGPSAIEDSVIWNYGGDTYIANVSLSHFSLHAFH